MGNRSLLAWVALCALLLGVAGAAVAALIEHNREIAAQHAARANVFYAEGDRHRQRQGPHGHDDDELRLAIDAYTQGIALSPSVSAFQARASTYSLLAGSASPEEATHYMELSIADRDQVIRLAPQDTYSFSARCAALLRRARLDDARRDCEHALGLSEANTDASYMLGMIALRQQRNQEAWDNFNAAFANAADQYGKGGALFGRSLAARRLGRLNDADADLAQAHAVDPNESLEGTFSIYGVS